MASSSISTTTFVEDEIVTLTATGTSNNAQVLLVCWVIDYTDSDQNESINTLRQANRVLESAAGSPSGTTLTISHTVTSADQNIQTLTPIFLSISTTQYMNYAKQAVLSSNDFLDEIGTTYNITYESASRITINGIATWLKQWFYDKDEIDAKFTYADWQSCTMSSGYVAYASGTDIKVRKMGKIVEIRGRFKNNNAVSTSNTETQFATVPSGYRPSQKQIKWCQGSTMNRWLLTIDTDGKMAFSRYGTTANTSASAGSWFPICITYMVD